MSRVVLRSYATVTAKPNDIPFQPKLANSVNLIGHVQSPIQFHVSPNDGYVWASTVITRQDSSDLSFSFVSLSLFFFIANPNLILFYVIVMLGFRLYLRVISLILPNFISI